MGETPTKTDLVQSHERDYTQDLAEMRSTFMKVVFGKPDSQSFFDATTPGHNFAPSETVARNEQQLSRSADKMFQFLNEVLALPKGGVYIPQKGVKYNQQEETTFAHASMEKKQNPSQKRYPLSQLWLSVYEPRDVEQSETEAWANRKDHKLSAAREELLNWYRRLSEKNTESAAQQRSRVMDALTGIARNPIGIDTVQYQLMDDNDRYTPQLGMKLTRFLDGYQVHPFVYEGRASVNLYDRPLLPGRKVDIPEMGGSLEVSLVSEEELAQTAFKRVFDALLSRVDWSFKTK